MLALELPKHLIQKLLSSVLLQISIVLRVHAIGVLCMLGRNGMI